MVEPEEEGAPKIGGRQPARGYHYFLFDSNIKSSFLVLIIKVVLILKSTSEMTRFTL